jgi:hypothetical protein
MEVNVKIESKEHIIIGGKQENRNTYNNQSHTTHRKDTYKQQGCSCSHISTTYLFGKVQHHASTRRLVGSSPLLYEVCKVHAFKYV